MPGRCARLAAPEPFDFEARWSCRCQRPPERGLSCRRERPLSVLQVVAPGKRTGCRTRRADQVLDSFAAQSEQISMETLFQRRKQRKNSDFWYAISTSALITFTSR